VFHLDVSKVDMVLQLVFHIHVSCVSSAFRRMLQVLHPDILKIDRVLHLYLRFFAASPSSWYLLLLLPAVAPPLPLLDADVTTPVLTCCRC
jgi:hypothetical protein